MATHAAEGFIVEIEAQHGLCALTGSPKQIAWARSIRALAIQALIREVEDKLEWERRGYNRRGRTDEQIDADCAKRETRRDAALTQAAKIPEARWWIDRNDSKLMAKYMEIYLLDQAK